MKKIRRTAFLCILVFMALSGCSLHDDAPATTGETPRVAASWHDLGRLCDETAYYKLMDDAGSLTSPLGTAYGTLSMNYNLDSTIFTLELGAGWFMEKASWRFGPVSGLPLTQNGAINTTAFPYQSNPAPYLNTIVLKTPFVDPGSNCHDLVFWCEVLLIDFFQGPINSSRCGLWAAQAPVLNGYFVEACYEPCNIRK